MAIISSVSSVVRKLIGVFLIGLFAFSITPVILLHEIVANHKDVSYNNPLCKGDQVSKAGINCHYISFVAEAQFLQSFTHFVIASPQFLSLSRTVFYTEDFYSQHHFFAELRGPPCFA